MSYRGSSFGWAARIAVAGLVVGVAGWAGALAGCNDATSCTPGKQIACACPDGHASAQVCADDGSGFGNCLGCPVVSTGSGNATASCDAFCAQCAPAGTSCSSACGAAGDSGCDAAWAELAATCTRSGCTSQACAAAEQAVEACSGPPTTSSGPGVTTGASMGGVQVACIIDAAGLCAEEKNVSPQTAAEFGSMCTGQDNGRVVTACPGVGSYGCCQSSAGTAVCYYASGPTTIQEAMSSCADQGGTWSATP